MEASLQKFTGSKRIGLNKIQVPSILLAFTMFFTGASGLVSEYLVSTVSSYILGNSIEQFSLIVGLMFFSMFLGAMVQQHVNSNRLVEKFIAVELLLTLLIGFSPLVLYASYAYLDDHFVLLQWSLAILIALLIGFEIPFAMRINERYVEKIENNVAGTVGPDYLGGFAGALIWTFFLLKRFPLTEIGFVVGVSNLLVATLTAVYFMAQREISAKIWLPILALVGWCMWYGYGHNRTWSMGIEQKLYDEPIVYAQTTRYQRLVMTYGRTSDEYRFYINGNLQFSSVDEERYHEQLIHPVMHLAPRHERVLILGGGDGLALREILKYPEVKQVTLVDLDPDMIKACSTNTILRKLNKEAFADARVHSVIDQGMQSNGERREILQETGKEIINKHGKKRPETERIAMVDVFTVDADRFLAKTQQLWDIIIVDLPDPNSIELAKLYSREFYLKARKLLTGSGFMVVQSTSPYHAKEAFLNIRRTMNAAGLTTLPYHDNVPSFGDWGWVMGWKSGRNLKKDIAALKEFTIPTRYLTPDKFRSALSFGKDELTTDKTDVSTLMSPTILEHYVSSGWKIE